jgi:hypothetical protein
MQNSRWPVCLCHISVFSSAYRPSQKFRWVGVHKKTERRNCLRVLCAFARAQLTAIAGVKPASLISLGSNLA